MEKYQRNSNKLKIDKDGYDCGRLRRTTKDKLENIGQLFQAGNAPLVQSWPSHSVAQRYACVALRDRGPDAVRNEARLM